ncbi:MAG: altronate dehydratase family protein [Bacteroidales bacterium]|nr:altronate dehydratase family protein [Bacteroidales bacterium]
MASYIRINPADNVAVALKDLHAGERAEFGELSVTLVQDIPAGHKFTLTPLGEGDDVVKYGFPIGHVTSPVEKGCMVDHSCIKTNLSGLLEYSYEPKLVDIPATQPRTFKGFRRADGQVGIRNQVWIIPTVGCVNGVADAVAARLREEKAGAMGSVDAIVSFPHNYGCSQLGDDHENTRRILADMVHHPNAGGVLIVSLGCENNQLGPFMELVGKVDPDRVMTIKVQEVEGDEVEVGLEMARSIFEVCSKDERTEVPVSELKVGLKCGGSDGLSGITANPLLGVFSDWIVAQGGTTVLTEVPEMFGAETILMNRCQDEETFARTVSLINDFKAYFMKNDQPVYENPSPGNKAGGISTLEEKSLGCTQKCGSSIVRDVLSYGERISTKGLNLLSAPGNDLVASTALAASGCQIVLFTTGRGTPFGSFVPTMKISTNSTLAARKPGWIDFNAGVLAEDEPMEVTSARFTEYVLEVAEGKATNNEKHGIREISIFKSGVTL